MIKDVYDFADLQNWREATAETDPLIRLGVFGDPVEQSASPPMHNAALNKLGIPVQYARIRVHADELQQALRSLTAAEFVGSNLTLPHKRSALEQMDELSEHARQIGAVNTVVVDGEKLIGFNTDGPGFVKAVRAEFSVDVRDLRVLLLGAGGGAGRAIAVQCAIERCERLVLVNRTVEKAKELSNELAQYFRGARLVGPASRLEAVPWDLERIALEVQNADLIINATSIGMKPGDPELLPHSILLPHLMVYDTIYTASRTKLMIAAEEAGARAANGLSMLLYQGALSFEIWFNREAPLDEMRAALFEHARASVVL